MKKFVEFNIKLRDLKTDQIDGDNKSRQDLVKLKDEFDLIK